MKITLAGAPGSGKSTLRQLLADHYGLEVKAVGDFMRQVAQRYGYTDITAFLVEYVTHHPEIDHEVDEEQREYGATHGRFVLDSHIGFHFVPDSLKIRLECDVEEAARRILAAKRTTESAASLEQAVEANRQREDTMHRNFLNLYGVDIHEDANFDIVVDTTSLRPEEVFAELCQRIDAHFAA